MKKVMFVMAMVVALVLLGGCGSTSSSGGNSISSEWEFTNSFNENGKVVISTSKAIFVKDSSGTINCSVQTGSQTVNYKGTISADNIINLSLSVEKAMVVATLPVTYSSIILLTGEMDKSQSTISGGNYKQTNKLIYDVKEYDKLSSTNKAIIDTEVKNGETMSGNFGTFTAKKKETVTANPSSSNITGTWEMTMKYAQNGQNYTTTDTAVFVEDSSGNVIDPVLQGKSYLGSYTGKVSSDGKLNIQYELYEDSGVVGTLDVKYGSTYVMTATVKTGSELLNGTMIQTYKLFYNTTEYNKLNSTNKALVDAEAKKQSSVFTISFTAKKISSDTK